MEKETLTLPKIYGLISHEFKGKMRGQVTIAGRYNSRKFGVSALSKIVGVLQQDPDTQLFNPTVEEEIVFGACNYGLPVDVIRKRTEYLLELTRLTAHRRKNPHRTLIPLAARKCSDSWHSWHARRDEPHSL